MTRSRFGQPSKPRMGDPRYHTSRWRRTAKEVTVAPGYFPCWYAGCTRLATTADHIDPVYPGMPDSAFFDRSRLRPSCRYHNISRGFAAAIGAVETDQPESSTMARRNAITNRVHRDRLGQSNHAAQRPSRLVSSGSIFSSPRRVM